MSTIGDDLLDAKDPPIRAIYVYNSNPVAVAPEAAKVAAGFARDDLFCVVHEIFKTDTADYADILLPATTQLEQLDVHTSYGHLYMLANNPSIAPLGEAKPNTEVFRQLAARMGFTEPCFGDTDDDIARQALLYDHPRAAGITWDELKSRGFQRLAVPEAYAPFATGGFPTPSGKCELYSETLARQGHDPLPTFVPPRESVRSNPELAQRYPLAFISPPARNFLNSSFANLPGFVAEEKAPRLEIHAEDARARAIETGERVRIFNDRGSFTAVARVGERARTGVVVAPSIWWKKLSPDGANANAVTGQAPDRSRSRSDLLRLPGRGRANLDRELTDLELAHEPDHHAEDFERAFGTDHRVGLVLRLQHELAALDVEAFQRELTVDNRDDDVAALGRRGLLDHHQVAFENAGVLHRIALDPDQHRLRGALDQVVVDGQRIGVSIVDGIGLARLHG
jgi:hypothetical protein